MRALLVTLTVVEVVLVLAVLVVYLVRITRSLRAIASALSKVSFGVRAIETQCEAIGPLVTRINGQLAGISQALDGVADMAARRAARSGSG